MAWWKSPPRSTVRLQLVIALAIAFVFFGPLENALKYLHFSTLSKERLIREAKVYIRDRVLVRCANAAQPNQCRASSPADGDQMACLYVVACDGEHAHLELVSDIVGWDFRAAKDKIWRRRFSNYCPGRTTNFGLHLIPRAGYERLSEAESHAIWSFVDDRFIPQWNRFEGASFSQDRPWEQCTPGRAIVR